MVESCLDFTVFEVFRFGSCGPFDFAVVSGGGRSATWCLEVAWPNLSVSTGFCRQRLILQSTLYIGCIYVPVGVPVDRLGSDWRFLSHRTAVHVGLALGVAGLFLFLSRLVGLSSSLSVLAAGAFAVFLVIYGVGLRSSVYDGSRLWRLCLSLSSRESLVPLGLVAGLLLSGDLGFSGISRALSGGYDVFFLIFTFAVLSYGIDRSGFFQFLAFRTLALCRGSLPRLVLGFYLLSSCLTYVASNDVVVLAMTPFLLQVCREAGVRDVRVIFVSGCLVPANTMAMGLVFGSPTNLIVALSLGLGFVDYFLLMLAPSLVSLAAGFFVLAFLCRSHFRGGVEVIPLPAHLPVFDRGMLFWILLFVVSLLCYGIALSLGVSFGVISLLLVSGSLLSLAAGFGRPPGRLSSGTLDALVSLPWGIVGFGFSFFVLAWFLSSRLPLVSFLSWTQSVSPPLVVLPVMSVSAVLVNLVNDLPASALLGEVLSGLPSDGLGRDLVLQSVLASLNVSAYLTPVGALACLVWFHLMRRASAVYSFFAPGPLDLLRYGGLHFGVNVLALAGVLPGLHVLWRLLVSGGVPSELGRWEVFLSLFFLALVVVGALTGVRRLLSPYPLV